ncbi:uncharacterized protein LOC135340046 [Halichondria panicea]|uniref:uncharacterized protein LOC135340046 n=1 Tax=Halichondria panicea TaxID=6063 RepID=UPI00312B8C53
MATVNRLPSETTKLLHLQTVSRYRLTPSRSKLSLKSVCKWSPAVGLIFAWTFVIGVMYKGADIVTRVITEGLEDIGVLKINSTVDLLIAIYGLLAIVNMFYPLGGLLADVWCGRYRMVATSIFFLWLCLALVTVFAIVHVSTNGTTTKIVQVVFLALSFVMFIPAYAGYTSNIVQLGFDQLHDEPSQSLGMFVHWLTWAENLGITLVRIFNTVVQCTEGDKSIGQTMRVAFYLCPTAFLIIFSVVLVITLLTHRYFYKEQIHKNPYKLILNILNFTRKNKYPVRAPSAFVYTYHRKPSRIDYAKEVYGGPFTNSDVDDVKTFLRVLLVLFALGPINIIYTSTSYTLFPLFELHTGMAIASSNSTCTARWILLESGSLSNLITQIFMPVYIWVVYTVMRNRVPKILTRIGISAVFYTLSVASMLVIDLIGHVTRYINEEQNTICLFFQKRDDIDSLHMSWWVQIIPNLLLDIAPIILLATTLEFISAQGPHTMKGVLVGLLYAIRGFYQLISAAFVYPFSVYSWRKIAQESTIVSCEFGYFLVTLALALGGVVCFVVSACRYKYRVRGEEGFSQSDVEEVFERRIRQEQEYLRAFSQLELSASCQEEEMAD